MGRLLIGVVLVATACTLQSNSNSPPDGLLVPAAESHRWGFIDRDGSWRIPPTFKSVSLFSEGLAAVQSTEGWGFIDTEGKFRVQPQFGAVGDFSSGRAPVRTGRRWGFVDTTGKWIVEPKYQAASEFHEGRSRVEFWDKVCGKGNDEAPETFFDRTFTERNNIPTGQCGAENSRVGYIDTNGNEVIVPQYLGGFDFSEDRAVVIDRSSQLAGYVDRNGKLVLPFQFADAGPFSEGVASVIFSEDKTNEARATVINKAGRKLFPPRFTSITKPFSEGLGAALIGSIPKWIYIDKDGVTKISRRFVCATSFSEGLAAVCLENLGEQAYIDTSGRTVFRVPEGGEAQPIKNGIAAVKYPEAYMEYFDKSGRQILPKSH